jgi:hypothetical protein
MNFGGPRAKCYDFNDDISPKICILNLIAGGRTKWQVEVSSILNLRMRRVR